MDPKPAPVFHPRSEHACGPDALTEDSHPHDWSGHTHAWCTSPGSPQYGNPQKQEELPEGVTSVTEVDAVYSEWAGGPPFIRGTKKVYYVAGSKESYEDLKLAMAASSKMPPPAPGTSGLGPQQAL